MRWRNRESSDNIEDRRGQSGGGGGLPPIGGKGGILLLVVVLVAGLLRHRPYTASERRCTDSDHVLRAGRQLPADR